ncbi:type III secretion system effector protein (plasmid) [Pantoea stewartii subsp. stewartii DC283]|uniref:Type III secretion system effector protein n=2 Tax=Pantoea stewartii TaxID=66269 RepID=H3RKW3_PANSE|nr:type III secretion system effector protein [Pantoea stewartii subsp. stewartii DC283]EHT97958.1 putative type III secretion system effector protein [Pantoea stewartii subsp. stewartii DC283]KAB0556813.1 type III secretion system effector protein [Pantoea stewartii subsp. stewartii]
MVFLDASPAIEETGIPANRTLSVNDSVNVQGSGKGALDANDFFAMFDEIWSKLLMLAKQLRDTMQFYNQKKQKLSWGLEINTFQQSVKAIDDSYDAAKAGAIGGMFAGALTVGGSFFGEAGMTVGNAMGQVANGIGSWVSGSETRKADVEKAIAELQNKGAQSYAKTLDDTLMKAREIMRQMMEMGRNLVEVFSQVLRAISR